MGGTTNSQALRYPYVDEVITDVSTKNLADDIASKLTGEEAKRTLAMKRYSARARRNATQAYADGVSALVTFDLELWDPDNMIDLIGQPTRITVPAAGLYYACGNVFNTGSSSWTKGEITLLLNGNTRAQRSYWGAASQGPQKLHVSQFIYCANIGDFITMRLLHTGGGSTNVSAADLSVHRVTS